MPTSLQTMFLAVSGRQAIPGAGQTGSP